MKTTLYLLLISAAMACGGGDNTVQSTRSTADKAQLFATKWHNSDTIGLRALLADTLYSYSQGELVDESPIDAEINFILANTILGGYYAIEEILSANSTEVVAISLEHSGYLKYSPDTLRFRSTYRFRDGRIFEIHADTLLNSPHCYACSYEATFTQLSAFMDWLSEAHPDIDEELSLYYDALLAGDYIASEDVLYYEALQRRYFENWKALQPSNSL